MEDLERRWQRARRGVLHRSPTITDDGVALGCGTILVRHLPHGGEAVAPMDADRTLCLLAMHRVPEKPARAVAGLRKALAAWADGDNCLAHIRLAQLDLGRIESLDVARRLFMAEAVLDGGMAPRVLAQAAGLELPPVDLEKVGSRPGPILTKYDPDQPRNPAGSGPASGRWTKNPGSAADSPTETASAAGGPATLRLLAPDAPSLAEGIDAEALTWLTRLAGRLAIPVAVFGAAFIPSPNDGTAEEGLVPDRSGLRYRLDRDTGTLRLSNVSDADPTHALVAQLGPDGVYRDIDTRVAIARAVGDRVVLIDLDRAPAIADDAAKTDDGPKLCPAPKSDQPGGRKLFDVLYEQYVRDTVNPQRRPQLPPGLTFALPGDVSSGWVRYDDCRESDGAMIEAKGNYADLLAKPLGQKILTTEWLEQAGKQVRAAGNRRVDWYFHDPEAATFAKELFQDKKVGISGIHVLPYPGGVPNPNPRVRR